MTQRWVAAGLLLAAVGIVLARVVPRRATAMAVWREAELVRSQEQRAPRRAALRGALKDARPTEGGTPSASVRRVRREVLAVVATLPLAGVTIDVHESPTGPAVAEVKLGAKGHFADLVELSGRLAGAPGLALGVVRFAPRESVARVELEARSQ